MKKDKEPNFFTTLDVCLAASLFLQGHMPDFVKQGAKVIISFEETPELLMSLQKYLSGNHTVNAFEFSCAFKFLKSKVHERLGRS